MIKIAVLGAGYVTKPAIDYFLDTCGYEVLVTSLEKSEAQSLVGGRSGGVALGWSVDQVDVLESIVSEADLVLSMIPPHLHVEVAKACIRHCKNMVTTSYVNPDMEALDKQCRERDIIILNEIGEDPGLDNMNTMQMIDQVKAEKGRVVSVTSYGAGLPSFACNNNPFGYKFSWSPHGLISAAQSPAAYLKDGMRIEVWARDLFDHHWLVDLEGIGTFETYPNRDAGNYLDCFGLEPDVSLYRGLLRFPGWCNTMKYLAELDLFNTSCIKDFSGMTYAQLIAGLIKADHRRQLKDQVADYLKLSRNSDFIKRLDWLGMLEKEPIRVKKGSHADVLVERMTRKLYYTPSERDMVIIYTELLAEFPDFQEKRVSSLLLEGDPGGDSAMSRSVSLPAAIAAKLIVENKIALKGVQRPTSEVVYRPVLDEMKRFGYLFAVNNYRVPYRQKGPARQL